MIVVVIYIVTFDQMLFILLYICYQLSTLTMYSLKTVEKVLLRSQNLRCKEGHGATVWNSWDSCLNPLHTAKLPS